MTNQHPIQPSPELVQQCWDELRNQTRVLNAALAWGKAITLAYQAGADQELEACVEWLDVPNNRSDRGDGWLMPHRLRAHRRLKPPSLRKQAYDALDTYIYGEPDRKYKERTYNTIRKALEELPDDN